MCKLRLELGASAVWGTRLSDLTQKPGGEVALPLAIEALAAISRALSKHK